MRKVDLKLNFDRAMASVFLAGTVTLFVLANKLTTAANAILLQYTAPIYVALLSPFLLREEMSSKRDWLGISTAMLGLVLFFLDELDPTNFLGNCVAIGSGISFALYNIFMRRQKDGSPITATFLGNVLTFLMTLPFVLASIRHITTKSAMVLLSLGVFQLGIPYVLYSVSIKHVRAIEALLIAMLEPILNPLWVFLVFGEKPGKWALVGGGLVIFSMLTHSLTYLERKTRK